MHLSKSNQFLIYLIVFSLSTNIFAVYRAYDVYRPGAVSAATGGTGVSNIHNLGDVSQNPAFIAELDSSRFVVGVDAQTRITRVQTDVRVKPQFLPIISYATDISPNGSIGVLFYSPFQRHFLEESYIYYNLELAYAYQVHRYLSVAVTAGPGLGLQAERFPGWSFAGSLSLLYRSPLFSAGFLYRPGSNVSYDIFTTGNTLKERLPDFIKFGISKQFREVEFALEAEVLNWDASSYIENGKELKPSIDSNFLGRMNLHFGASFPIPKFPGLKFRTGVFTEDFIDFQGRNDRQILFTLGLGGLASRHFWGDRLQIDFALISSFIPSIFWEENHQIEKMQLTFEFVY